MTLAIATLLTTLLAIANMAAAEDPFVLTTEASLTATVKVWLDIIQAAVTSAGIVVVGVWTYVVFIKGRQPFPKGELTQKVSVVHLTDSLTLVHVETRLANTGEVILRFLNGLTRLQQILPIRHELLEHLRKRSETITLKEEEGEFPWYMIGKHEWKYEGRGAFIEPGENETLHTDFVIPSSVTMVRIYSYVSDISSKARERRELGWQCITTTSLQEGIRHANGETTASS